MHAQINNKLSHKTSEQLLRNDKKLGLLFPTYSIAAAAATTRTKVKKR